jgi:hypothetical protein
LQLLTDVAPHGKAGFYHAVYEDLIYSSQQSVPTKGLLCA